MVSQISSTPWTLKSYVDDKKAEWTENFLAFGADVLSIHEPQRMGSDLFLFRKYGADKVKIVQIVRQISDNESVFKVVCEAHELTNGKKYALSNIKTLFGKNHADLSRLAKREIENLRKFKGSKVVLQTSYAGTIRNLGGREQVYILTRYCEEGDLAEHLGKLAPQQIFQITQDLVEALLEFKRWKLLHQDIKPKNVFLYLEKGTKNLHAKLGDLGLANAADGKPAEGDSDYASPSKRNWNGFSTYQSDVWALGYVIHIMVYGDLNSSNVNFCFKDDLAVPNLSMSEKRLSLFTKPIDRLIFGMMNPDESKALTIEQAKIKLSHMEPGDFANKKGRR